MACPTCDHTMSQLGISIRMARFWCQRCGTMTIYDTVENRTTDIYTPKLIERCREFEKTHVLGSDNVSAWHILGIEESINLPQDRPQ